jgi:hypothetical protein
MIFDAEEAEKMENKGGSEQQVLTDEVNVFRNYIAIRFQIRSGEASIKY